MLHETIVRHPDELRAATRDASVGHIVVRGAMANLAALRLGSGQALRGEGEDASLSFADDSDGVQSSTDNDASALRIETSPARRAIFHDTSVAGLGRMRLAQLVVVGRGVVTHGEDIAPVERFGLGACLRLDDVTAAP